jgi:hypothetical protein
MTQLYGTLFEKYKWNAKFFFPRWLCTAGIPTVLVIHTSAVENSNYLNTEGNLHVTETQ